jgi:hypothetical protein
LIRFGYATVITAESLLLTTLPRQKFTTIEDYILHEKHKQKCFHLARTSQGTLVQIEAGKETKITVFM